MHAARDIFDGLHGTARQVCRYFSCSRPRSLRNNVSAYVALERRQIDVVTARQAEKVLDERMIVSKQRSGADEGAELVGTGLECVEQLIEGLDVEVVQSLGTPCIFQPPVEVAPA